MSQRLVKFILIFVITLSSAVLYSGDATRLTTSFFTLPIPQGMHEILRNEDKSHYIFQYVYQTQGNFESSGMQLRVTQIQKVPENVADYDQFLTQTLGVMIAIFADSYHLSLQNQSEVLGKKPNSIKLGNQIYKSVSLNFDKMRVEFLTTIVKNSTYTFYLVGVDEDEAKRKADIDLLRKQLNAIEYH